ncbi:MAG: protein kinase [Pseudomonadota bacterium]|nr:protein kinase [Pseudomonadota bacterium]
MDLSIARMDRFEIRRVLGRGAQGVVYLAFDPKLEREVAIKALHKANSDNQRLQTAMLLREARTIGKLQHPNIVCIHEAGHIGGSAYLVLEYVDGPLLSQMLRSGKPMDLDLALSITMQVLDGLSYAHERSVIHGDIKPANIILDRRNTPKLMDFGLASAESTKSSDTIGGTPRYMAPEYVQRGERSPACDIYAVGLIFYAMVTGKRAVEGDSIDSIFHEITRGEIIPAPQLNPGVDTELNDIITRATAKEPTDRYASCAEMRNALAAYRTTGSANQHTAAATTQKLLRRVRSQRDFPALSQRIVDLNLLFTGDPDIMRVSEIISRDVALANKLLRIVNSAFYANAGGEVETISRAVVMLGFRTVRDIAASLTVIDHVGEAGGAQLVRNRTLSSLFSAILAQKIAVFSRYEDIEEIFLCAMFHRLGWLLAAYYLPEACEEIQDRILRGDNEDIAATNALGMTLTDLGQEIARDWCLPEQIVRSMEKPDCLGHSAPVGQVEQLQVVSAFANELVDTVTGSTAETLQLNLEFLLERFSASYPMAMPEALELLRAARDEFNGFASTTRVQSANSPLCEKLTSWPDSVFVPDGEEDSTARLFVVTPEDHPAPPGSEPPTPRATPAVQAVRDLAAEIANLETALERGTPPRRVLDAGIKVLCQAGPFDRAVLCLFSRDRAALKPAAGWGTNVRQMVLALKDQPIGSENRVADALEQRRMLLLALPAPAEVILPDWLPSNAGVTEILILPVLVGPRPIAFYVAERDTCEPTRQDQKHALQAAARLTAKALRKEFSR